MVVDFTNDKNDFLIHQLFIASKSERIKKKRYRNKIMVPLIYAGLGGLFILQDHFEPAVIFLIVGALWFIFYPLWERRYYIRHYKNHIQEHYKERFGKKGSIEFNNDILIAKDEGAESRVLTTELEEINEIPTNIFLRLKGGHSFILPKEKISEIDSLKVRLKELAEHLGIKYTEDEQWRWK